MFWKILTRLVEEIYSRLFSKSLTAPTSKVMTPSKQCLELIKLFEGCRLKSYLDARPTDKRWTVGFGATGSNIGPETVWTQAQADQDLMNRVEAIGRIVTFKVQPLLTQNQLDALCCFVYNVGTGAFGGSSLLRCLNGREFDKAADELLKWDKAGGVVLKGLTQRRQAERALFLK